MSKELKLYAFRYFLIPPDQVSLTQLLIKDKSEIIKSVLADLKDNYKLTKYIRNRKHILYYTDSTQNLFLCKFAKETRFTKHQEGDIDIKSTKELDFPFIYIIFDLSHQIILIQNNSSVYRHILTAKNTFKEWFDNIINNKYDHYFKLDEITYEQTFWKYINESDKIYELNLNMKSPNLFGAFLETNKLLNNIKEIFNNTETDFNLKNEKGLLKVEKDNLEDGIKYITGGGGKYKIKRESKGRIEVIKSQDYIKTISLNENFEDTFDKDADIISKKISALDEIIGEPNNEKID